VFRPAGDAFEDGHFEDIGGTDLVPDFGGFYHDSDRDKAGPDINLVDLDNDGDLDLLQSYHCDVREPLLPYSPGEYRQGVFCWRNLLAETGELRFEKVTDNGLACEARLTYNRDRQLYEPTGTAPGLPYISLADADNDGLVDVLAVGPADPGWAPRAEYVHGRFWRNLGGFRFEEATEPAGLQPINWTYRQWYAFWQAPIPARFANWRPRSSGLQGQPGLRPLNPIDAHGFYAADALFGDFDNDGWVDLVVLDRSESHPDAARAMLFMGRGDGTFELKPTEFSGLDASGICGQVADLNNDGLLDLVFAADPDNSGSTTEGHRYQDRVYLNTGLHGARQNHWLRLRFTGVSDAELIGARVEAREPGTGRLLGMRTVASHDSYKSGCPLEVHFGLGAHTTVALSVHLPDGREIALGDVSADRYLSLEPTVKPTLFMGGHGMLSTAGDYERVCRMILNRGELDGVRVLRPETVDLIFQNHVPAPGQMYGLGGAVDGRDSYGWGGADGTHFWTDRSNNLFAIFMTQTDWYRAPTYNSFRALVFEAAGIDRDGDGRVTAEEAGGAASFGRLDTDGDGAVRLEEARVAIAAMGGGVAGAPTTQQDFVPDAPFVGEIDGSYIDPEFSEGASQVVFQDVQNRVWVGDIDAETGLFRTATGRDYLMDEDITIIFDRPPQGRKFSTNGPEWTRDEHGHCVVYTKQDEAGIMQQWLARWVDGRSVVKQLTHGTTDCYGNMPSRFQDGKRPRLAFTYNWPIWQAKAAWVFIDKPEELHQVPGFDYNKMSMWSAVSPEFLFVQREEGAPYGQVARANADTGAVQVLTNDEGQKDDPGLFAAPEFGGEILLVCKVDNSALGISPARSFSASASSSLASATTSWCRAR
ncbi:MAG: FG-GAP-like repeat-containing protein, partial [Armatimonadota bacterium]